MPMPSPARLERLLAPYAGARGLPIRVWGVDAGAVAPAFVSVERQIFGGPPRLLCLGGGEDGLVVVRQTNDGLEDPDGVLVPWEQVRHLERDPHLVRDLVAIEIAGSPPVHVAVSNHLLLPHNRSAAKALCDLVRSPREPVRARATPLVPEAETGGSVLPVHPAAGAT